MARAASKTRRSAGPTPAQLNQKLYKWDVNVHILICSFPQSVWSGLRRIGREVRAHFPSLFLHLGQDGVRGASL